VPTGSRGEGVDETTWTNSLHSKYCFRHLSLSIAPKQHFLTLELTVKLARPDAKLPVFKCLHVLETIEWE
jgi:hypothetical protein